MKLVKVGAAVLNQTPFDWDGNQAHILEAIRLARADDVTVLCLPEMAITGYGCEDAFFSPGLQEQAFAVLEAIAPATRGMVVSVGLPLYFEKALYNAGALLVDPFCGSGTTLVEARFFGVCALGLDLSPLAVLIARAKTWTVSPTRRRALRETAHHLAGEALDLAECFAPPVSRDVGNSATALALE